ncbi:MAG TPA: hypothetical protein V6D17_15450 [Candidatus Obscuribacterales bacterium]
MMNIALRTFVLSVVLFSGIETMADPDLWWHIRFGLDILQRGSTVSVDPYSYLTTGCKWVNYAWLAEVVQAWFYKNGGKEGLVALKVLLVGGTAAVAWRYIAKEVAKPFDSLIISVMMLLLAPNTYVMRPNVFSLLFLTLELLALDRFTKNAYELSRASTANSASAAGQSATGGSAPAASAAGESSTSASSTKRNWSRIGIWSLPFLFIVWVNCHGLFLLGLAVLTIWMVAFFVEALFIKRSSTLYKAGAPLLFVLLLSLAATVVNPDGFEYLKFYLTTGVVSRPEYQDISEWQPLAVNSFFGLTYLAALAASIMSIFLTAKSRSMPAIVVWLTFSCLPLIGGRLLPVFGVATVMLMGPHIGSCLSRLQFSRFSFLRPGARFAAICLFVCSAVIFFFSYKELGVLRNTHMPYRLVSILKEKGIQANALVPFDWGGYFLFHLGPRLKVAIDGRQEFVFSPHIQELYHWFYRGIEKWDALVDEYRTELVVATPGSPPWNLMSLKPGWVKVYEDDACSVFAKKGSVLATQLSM